MTTLEHTYLSSQGEVADLLEQVDHSS